MENSKIFDRLTYQKRRNQVAAGWKEHNFLKIEATQRLCESLQDIARSFPLVLDIGCHHQEMARALPANSYSISTDFARNMRPDVVCDEELLPFAENSFDLVTAILSLHHVNDLVGTLIQIRHILKPDGLFAAVIYGANTLKELRAAVLKASTNGNFPLSPRISPFVEVRDAGALLQRSGFALPVVHNELIELEYDNPFALMKDIKGQGEMTILSDRSKYFTTRSHLGAIAQHYHKDDANQQGTIPATIELITLTGWKPDSSQQQPAKKGSGTINLQQVLS